MKAYLIAEVEVLDPEKYGEYARAAQPIVERHGGRYLVRGGAVTSLSGEWNPQRLLVIEFESPERLRECFACEDYRRITPLRLESTRSRSVIVEGISQP